MHKSKSIIALIGCFSTLLIPWVAGQQKPLQYRPFSAEIKVTYFDEDDRATTFTKFFSRKEDGSFSRLEETEVFDLERGTRQYIADVPRRSLTTIDSFTKSIIVDPLVDDRDFNNIIDSAGNCLSLRDGTWTPVEEKEMFGVRAVLVERVISKKHVNRLWLAPDLECFPLISILLENNSVRTKEEVISLRLGEPNLKMFELPIGYGEVSPLQFEELWKKRFGGRSYYGDADAQVRERKYQEAKRQRR